MIFLCVVVVFYSEPHCGEERHCSCYQGKELQSRMGLGLLQWFDDPLLVSPSPGPP